MFFNLGRTFSFVLCSSASIIWGHPRTFPCWANSHTLSSNLPSLGTHRASSSWQHFGIHCHRQRRGCSQPWQRWGEEVLVVSGGTGQQDYAHWNTCTIDSCWQCLSFSQFVPQSRPFSCGGRIWGRCGCVCVSAPGTLGTGGYRTQWWPGSSPWAAWIWAPCGPDSHPRTDAQTSDGETGGGERQGM